MRLVWSKRSKRHLQEIYDYIAQENAGHASTVLERIDAAAQQLISFPRAGRAEPDLAVRRLMVSGMPYILPYRVRQRSVEILAVFHARRDWRNLM